jgi:hypothetical protein
MPPSVDPSVETHGPCELSSEESGGNEKRHDTELREERKQDCTNWEQKCTKEQR